MPGLRLARDWPTKADVVTEDEWLACDDPEPMLGQLEGLATDRQLRTFGVACIRRVWHLLRYERGRAAVEVAERFAEGGAGEVDLAKAFASMTMIPVGDGFINVPSPRWFTPDPSEPLPGYRGEPGDHGAMGAAQAVCSADARYSASEGSRRAAEAVAEVAWHEAKIGLDWGDFPEAHRRAKEIARGARSAERREQAMLLRRTFGGRPPRYTSAGE